MKKILLLVLVVVSLASCQQKKIDRMQAIQDSLMQVGMAKDSDILNFVSTMTDIQMNLDSIKQIEELVKIETSNGSEMKKSAKDQIIEDISTINQLLQKNKEMVAKLQKQLSSSNAKVAELQKAIELLNKQIEQKDAEIATLNAQLEKMNIDIAGLNTRIGVIEGESAEKSRTIESKTQTIEEQTTELNKAYYAFGTTKELETNNVIEKSGGVLGVGKTWVMKKEFNEDYFTKIDIRDLKTLELQAKKAELITTHPAGSYHFEGEKPVESLVIDNSQLFWSTSKYLVIAVD